MELCLECQHKFFSLKQGPLVLYIRGWPIRTDIDIWYDDISIPTPLCIGVVAGPGAFGPEYLLRLLIVWVY